MNYRRLAILLIYSMVVANLNPLLSQSHYSQSVPKVIKKWEKQHGLILNYDFERLIEYTFSGVLGNESAEEGLRMILKSTPFEFNPGDQIYTLYSPPLTTYNLCGTIRSSSGEVLPYANILYSSQEIGAQSDSLGRFQLTVEGFKNDQVSISYLGYSTCTIYLADLVGCQDIILRNSDQMVLQNVIIKEYLYNGVSLGDEHGSIVFDYSILTQDHSVNEHDILTTIQLLPGVSSTDESATNLSIRGSTPDQNLILWENSTLYDPGHMFGMISSVNPFIVDEVKLHKGVYNPKYDNRIGGLIDISLPSEPVDRFIGSAGITMTEAHGTLMVPVLKDKIGLFVGGRRNLSAIVKTPTFTNYVNRVFQNTKIENEKLDVSEGIIDATDQLNYSDLNVKLIVKLNNKMSFSASSLWSSNVFDYTSDFIENQEQNRDVLDYTSFAASMRMDFNWNTKFNSSISYNRSDYDNAYQSSFINTNSDQVLYQLANDNNIDDRILSIDNTLKIGPTVKLNFGVINDKKKVNFSSREERELELDYITSFDQKEDFIHLYTAYNLNDGTHELDLSTKATIATQSDNSWIFSPRGSYHYNLNPEWQFKISGGRVYQFISQVRDLGITDINSGTNFWVLREFDNDNLLYADKFSLGTVFISRGWLIDVEGYYNQTQNLQITNNNALDLINIENLIGLKSNGVELLVKKQWRKYGFWLNYTISKNTYSGADFGISTPSENDQRHRLSFVNSIDIKDFNINLTYQYKTGLPLSEPTGILELIGDDNVYYDLAFSDGVNQNRLNDYSRLDLSISWTKRFNSLRFQSSLSFINLLNREHVAARSFLINEDEDEFGDLRPFIFSLEKRLLGFTPRVMIRCSF